MAVIRGTPDWGIATVDEFARDMGNYEWGRQRWLLRFLNALFILDADCNFAIAARRHFQNMGHATPSYTKDFVDRMIRTYLMQSQNAHLKPIEGYLRQVGYCAVGLKGAVGTPEQPINLVAPPAMTIEVPYKPAPAPAEPPTEGTPGWVKAAGVIAVAYAILRG